MISGADPIIGTFIIFDNYDVDWKNFISPPTESVVDDSLYRAHLSQIKMTNLVGYRNLEIGEVRLLKNRNGPISDLYMEEFVLEYGTSDIVVIKEIFESIESRFDILDL